MAGRTITVQSVSSTSATLQVSAWTPSATALPRANWDSLSASGASLSVSGWAFDPDQPTVSTKVHVYVDGRGTVVEAADQRPDVGAAFPGVGEAHGFSATSRVAPGSHSVCLYVIDVDDASRNTSLGCRSITTS